MVNKAKKHGVKPGTKRGRYRKAKATHTSISYKDWAAMNKPDPVGTKATITSVHGNTLEVGDIVTFGSTAEPVKSKTFADCMFEIINSNMEQSAKTAAFKAMEEAAKTEVAKSY